MTDRLGCDADFSTSPADLMERARSILSAPLPACLQLDGTTIAPPPLPAASASYLRRLLQLSANPHPAHRPAQDGFGAEGKPIHEVLLEKGRLAQEHKEKLAQDYIAKEVSELRPAPGLTQTRRLPPPGERIEDKLLRRGKEREAQRQQVAEQHAAREAETLAKVAPFRPTISDRARRTQTRYTEPKVSPRLAEARAKRQEQREQERLAAEAADLAEVKEVPTINERSRKLAARKDAKDGLAGLDPVEALLARDHLAKLKRWEQSHADLNKSATSSGTAVPRITSYAASLDRPGDVGTRLYATHQDTLTRQQVRWMEEQALAAPFVPQITAKATLTAPRYHRSVRQSTSVASETDSAEDEPAWSARQVERQLRSSLTRRSAEVEEAAAAHQPVIDPVSAAIASQLPETSRERLYRGVTHRQVPRHADASSDIVAFEGSRRGGSSDAGLPPSFLDALAAYEARRQARLEALIEEEERRREAEHTFAPRINRAPFFPLMDEGSGGSGHNDDEDASWYEEEGGPAAVAARSQRWLRRKEARLAQRRHQLEREREEAAEAEMRAAATTLRSRSAPRGGAHAAPGGCDEAAGRGDRRADGDSLLASAAAFPPPPPPPGVQAYLQRQARAQRERAEREALLQSTALGQRPARAAPTVPRSPTLGGRPHCSIRSLRRPVDPLRQRREERSGSRSPTPPDAVERSVSSALSSLPTFERIYRSVYRGESGFH